MKIGAPHFVDFGKELEHSPDGKAYLVAHGASDGVNRRYAYNSWITGDEIYLARVSPSVENMNNVSKYEFFAGQDSAGQPVWTRDFGKIKPTAAWRDNMGCVTITYNPPLKKYLMCVTDGTKTVTRFNTYILETDALAGPWKMVAYLKNFGEQAYFVNFPSKFILTDGRSLWLCYSGNFSEGCDGIHFKSLPVGSRYGMCLQEVRLLSPDDPITPPSALSGEDNIAPLAKVTVSSTHPEYSLEGLTDGSVDGYPGNIRREWCTQGERETAMVRLTWDSEQSIDRIWLFDRPNALDQIRSEMLIFSDGSIIRTGELPDNAQKGLEVKFSPNAREMGCFRGGRGEAHHSEHRIGGDSGI